MDDCSRRAAHGASVGRSSDPTIDLVGDVYKRQLVGHYSTLLDEWTTAQERLYLLRSDVLTIARLV